ncbi:MAG: histidinol-phosphatase [Desulfuromonadaceae bacterium]|nr:histidinol-phosphatase [Desulfuromonadaceae bacterium]
MGLDSVPARVSAHGGHSGQFCLHAEDELEAVVQVYITQGFIWVGITEHMPPPQDQYRYADEKKAGISALTLQHQFADYVAEVERLKQLYSGDILLLTGMESECYPGAFEYALELQQRYALDYIVGSVHHVRGINFDFCPAQYEAAIAACGNIDALYCAYFDEQFTMLEALCPAVVGHFDLVRLYDQDYAQRILNPEIMRRIERNLKYVRDNGLCLDLNMRALAKGASEPYISRPILVKALNMGINILPGDDSHGVSSVGNGIDAGIALLQDLGYGCAWNNPGAFIRSGT